MSFLSAQALRIAGFKKNVYEWADLLGVLNEPLPLRDPLNISRSALIMRLQLKSGST